MRSRIYTGRVFHTRISPVRHAFAYPIFFLYLDLSELQATARGNPFFGYNTLRPCSVSDTDYLGPDNLSLQEKIKQCLSTESVRISSVFLLTMPRILGIGFNPVSFFFCLDGDGAISAVVVEVANTYHEKHTYLLCPAEIYASDTARPLQYEFLKELFVSPFNGTEGCYRLRFSGPGNSTFRLGLDLTVRGEKILQTGLVLYGEPLDASKLASILIRYPCTIFLTLPRIAYQAALLRLRKGLKPRLKPKASPCTIGSGKCSSGSATTPQEKT